MLSGTFAIGAIFKNESHILKEWIDHHKYHGIEHIYMINDHSSDDYLHIIKPYLDDGYVTLFHAPDCEKYVGIQDDLYNKFFLDVCKNWTWFGVIDLDEFLWSPESIDIKPILNRHMEYAQILVTMVLFGSNGFINQPREVVKNFILRKIDNGDYITNINIKGIVQSKYVDKFGIHWHSENFGKNINLTKTNELIINHYHIQSWEFFKKIKMTRGDANDSYKLFNYTRDECLFKKIDSMANEIKDERLAIQNNILGVNKT